MGWIKPLAYLVLIIGAIVLGLRIVDKQTARLSTKMVHWLAAALFVLGEPLMSSYSAVGDTNTVLIAMAKSIAGGAALFGGWLLIRLLMVWGKSWAAWRQWLAMLLDLMAYLVVMVITLSSVQITAELATAQPGIAAMLAALAVVGVWLLIVWAASCWVARRVASAKTDPHTDPPESDIQPQGHAV